LHGGDAPEIFEVLHPGELGHVVSDVEIVFVADGAGVFYAFVGASAEGEVMGGFGFGLVAEEDAALHLLWNGGAGEAEPCFGHVDEADEAVDFLAGCWGGPERFVVFGDADDEGAVQAVLE